MNKNQKKRQLNRGLSIALALLLAATVCITIIAFVSSKRAKPTETKSSQTTASVQTTAKSTQAQTTGEKPVDKPVTADPEEFVCPVTAGTLSKEFSSDVPVWSTTMEDYRIHSGIDISADAGAEVLAAASGTVTKVYADPMMGQTIVITHSDDCRTVYRNLQSKLPSGIAEGVSIRAGEVIGYVGDTSLIEISDSPHLHFEIISGEKSVDPLSYFSVPSADPSTDYEDAK